MKRVRNSDDFSTRIRCIHDEYNYNYQPLIEAIRKQYAVDPESIKLEKEKLLDNSLERHTRQYVVDRFLKALNWHFETDLPNLVAEAPVYSIGEKTTRFLDYLGVNENRQKALLIIETKRPNSKLPLPKGNRTGKLPRGESYESLISSSLSDNSQLTEEWQDWLKTLRDYSQSIKVGSGQSPKRVVITNGNWLIIFSNPEDAFNSEFPNQNNIFIYETWDEIEEKSGEIFKLLEYYEVLGNTPSLSLGELNFHLNPEKLDRAMFGVRLMYLEEPEFYLDSSPRIKVVPIIFIRSINGVWFCVEAQNPKHTKLIPNDSDDLEQHLTEFEQLACDLLNKINEKLETYLTCSSLREHYDDPNLFSELTPVTKINNNRYEEFLIVTGKSTHYLTRESTIPNCPYHHWDKSDIEGCATGIHVKRSTTRDPRTIFKTDVEHHCSHRDIMTAKSSKITIQNRDRCGSRSSENQGAFCEIWKFEEHLCCRTCAFEEICTKAEVFRVLPCKNGSV